MLCPWGLGLINYIWVTWAQKMYHVLSPEPYLQFSQNVPYFFQDHKKSHNITKSWKIPWPWNLGPINYIWATWAHKMYLVTISEPWFQFSQAGPHFLHNHNIHLRKLWNLKKDYDLVVWGQETTFGPLGLRRRIKL